MPENKSSWVSINQREDWKLGTAKLG